jgi:AcrR family transcriptional regulator
LSTPKTQSARKRLSANARRELIEEVATELFAERGYHATSIDEIARRAGISAPVVYDHFTSKGELHRRLLERHFGELRGIWREHAGREPSAERMPQALDSWFAYVESHPFAWRMLFRDTTGDPGVEAVRRDVAARSRAALLPLLAREPGAETVAGALDEESLDLLWEVFRAVLQGLAMWWYEHPHVPRERIVATAMNAIWIGFERALGGETWEPEAA